MMSEFLSAIKDFAGQSGLATIIGGEYGYLVMIAVACVLLYLAIAKGFEPLLLVPIAFGMLLVNLPDIGIKDAPIGIYHEDGFQPG